MLKHLAPKAERTMNKNVHNLIIAACTMGVLASSAPAQAIGYGFSRVVDDLDVARDVLRQHGRGRRRAGAAQQGLR